MRRRIAFLVAVVTVALGGGWWIVHDRREGEAAATRARHAAELRAVREELLAMRQADQRERTGEGLPPGTKLPPMRDYSRSVRLREIIARYGWPASDLVGRDGAEAAWLIAQHSDFDVDFQERAAALMRSAVAAGTADPTDLAYLEDRVAVNRGRPQRYGSQVRCRDGRPDPATPLADPAAVDRLRAQVGLGALAEYHRELALMCSQEQAEGAQPAP